MFEPITIFTILPLILLAGIVVYLEVSRGFTKKNSMVKNNSPKHHVVLPEPEDKVILHGHDLGKWHYLGYTSCSYVDENGKTIEDILVFLFASKNDLKRRSFYTGNKSAEKNHTYISGKVKPWAAGEGKVYYLINGKNNLPSDFLKEYMLENFSSEWDEKTNWWSTADEAKYNSAKIKQKNEENTKKKVAVENNVVAVDFGSKDSKIPV